MARSVPVLPDDKVQFYTNKLEREVSNLFKWEGLPEEIPVDYLESALVRTGRVMFFYDEEAYGYMALEGQVRGFNLYNQPTKAFSIAPNDTQKSSSYDRVITHKYDENIDKNKACVLINNMYNGESLKGIIDHYAYRLALVQQAFDTNAMWQNIPVIIPVDTPDLKLSVESLFHEIFTGKPWSIVDKSFMSSEGRLQADPITVPYLLDKLYDAKNEIYNEFKQTIGIDAPGADKKERLLVDEVNSNRQFVETCLEVMLSQRKIACEEIQKVFGIDINVNVIGREQLEWEGDSDGELNNGVETPTTDE